MPRSNPYKILAEKYDALINEERVVRLVPFSIEEQKVLTHLYDFKVEKDNKLKRIPAAGEIETLTKYSDNTYVVVHDDTRTITKHEYSDFCDLTTHLTQKYHADISLDDEQIPTGKDMPNGVQKGGQDRPAGLQVN